MWSDDTKRPNYYEGQYLGPGDFTAEQQYHRDMRRRLSLGQHAWGIFVGLDLEEREQEGNSGKVDVFVTPGLGVDGFGRELIVFAPHKVDPALFQRFTTDSWVRVWLCYATEATDPPRYGYEVCANPDLAYRTRETFQVMVGEVTQSHDRVVIAGTATNDVDLPTDLSVPHQALPDDAENARWLVPLGWVHWNGTDGFVKSETPEDLEKRVQHRVYGGVISAHTYAPDLTWELVTRRAPVGGVAQRVSGTVRGKLTVEDLLVAQGDGIDLHAGRVSFLNAAGEDLGVPLVVDRVDRAGDEADLRVKIGEGSSGDNRMLIVSGTTERVRFKDNGDVDVTGQLHVDGVLDLVGGEGDRVVLWGAADDEEATALGLEGGGGILYSRAQTGFRWYVGALPDAGVSARMRLNAQRLRIRGDTIVGHGGNGRLSARHVDGKSFVDDSVDDLFLNWDMGTHVVVGNLTGTPSSLWVSGDAGIGTSTPRNRLGIRGRGTAEELLSFEDATGVTHWHINQNLGGTNRGLNFAETNAADGRLFLQDGGNVGVGTTDPQARLDVSGRIFRNGQQFSFSGIATHDEIVELPWGATTDWNILVSPREMGTAGLTAMRVFECFATVVAAGWQITARFQLNAGWVDGTANYVLVPR